MTDGKAILELNGHWLPIMAAQFSPDGKIAATAGEDRDDPFVGSCNWEAACHIADRRRAGLRDFVFPRREETCRSSQGWRRSHGIWFQAPHSPR